MCLFSDAVAVSHSLMNAGVLDAGESFSGPQQIGLTKLSP